MPVAGTGRGAGGRAVVDAAATGGDLPVVREQVSVPAGRLTQQPALKRLFTPSIAPSIGGAVKCAVGGCALPSLRVWLVAEPVDGKLLEAVELPPGGSWFSGGLRPVPADAGRGAPAGSVLLETLVREQGLRVLMVNPGGVKVLVNDHLAPPLVLLKERDRLSISFGSSYEVAVFNQPCIGPVPAEFVGQVCPACRGAFSAGQRAFQCPHCRRPMHLEEGPDDEVLKCAQCVTNCPSCEKPVRLAAGWLTEPWSGTAS